MPNGNNKRFVLAVYLPPLLKGGGPFAVEGFFFESPLLASLTFPL